MGLQVLSAEEGPLLRQLSASVDEEKADSDSVSDSVANGSSAYDGLESPFKESIDRVLTIWVSKRNKIAV